jgi:hypothetical protein
VAGTRHAVTVRAARVADCIEGDDRRRRSWPSLLGVSPIASHPMKRANGDLDWKLRLRSHGFPRPNHHASRRADARLRGHLSAFVYALPRVTARFRPRMVRSMVRRTARHPHSPGVAGGAKESACWTVDDLEVRPVRKPKGRQAVSVAPAARTAAADSPPDRVPRSAPVATSPQPSAPAHTRSCSRTKRGCGASGLVATHAAEGARCASA